MKASAQQTKQHSPGIGKAVLAFVAAVVLAGVSMTPALADDHQGRHDNGRHNGERNRDRHDQRDYRQDHRHPYYYSAPVYAPRPVYYYDVPQPSPGISLFFPLDIRR